MIPYVHMIHMIHAIGHTVTLSTYVHVYQFIKKALCFGTSFKYLVFSSPIGVACVIASVIQI